MRPPHTLAAAFQKWALRQFETVERHTAQTNTEYVTVLDSGHEFKVRFADHAECYCTEDISVDQDGYTLEQAKAATTVFFQDPSPRENERAQEARAARREDIEARKRERELKSKNKMKLTEMTPGEVLSLWPFTEKQRNALRSGDSMLARQIARKIKTTPACVFAAAQA